MKKQTPQPKRLRKVGVEVFTSRRSKYDPDAWTKAYADKLALPSLTPFEFYPTSAEEQQIRSAKAPVFLPLATRTRQRKRSAPEVKLRRVKNPAPRASLGYAGPVAKLDSKERFFRGVLAFPIHPKQTRDLVPETIRVFRWDSKDSTFTPVEPGGFKDRYAWARISSPGI